MRSASAGNEGEWSVVSLHSPFARTSTARESPADARWMTSLLMTTTSAVVPPCITLPEEGRLLPPRDAEAWREEQRDSTIRLCRFNHASNSRKDSYRASESRASTAGLGRGGGITRTEAGLPALEVRPFGINGTGCLIGLPRRDASAGGGTPV
eukprot:scaffold52724_cov26-Tisochrysis_lutea.AAC.3